MAISSYSPTAASNTSISGINIDEGCAPSGINDAIRQIMADIASGARSNQLPTATGTANAVVVALSPAVTSYVAGQRFEFLPASNNTTATTINYGGGVINLTKHGSISLASGDLAASVPADVIYDGTRAVLLNAQTDVSTGSGSNFISCTAGGTSDVITLTPNVVVSAYASGQVFSVLFTATNTTTTPTANVSSLGAKNIKKSIGNTKVNPAIGDIQSGSAGNLFYDGTDLILMAPRSYSQGADIASASTVNLDTATGDYVHITGTTSITAMTLAQGQRREVVFDGVLTLTNGASLILDSGANIITAAGDKAVFRGEASGVVRMMQFTPVSGKSLVGTTPVGIISPYAGSSAPTNWLLCYGQAVSRTTYALLFAAIGTAYGAGDGSTTFNVPDLRGRVVAGLDNMGGSAASRLTGISGSVSGTTLGASGGEEAHTLTTPEIPSHSHVQQYANAGSGVDNTQSSTAGKTSPSASAMSTQSTGGGGAHNNVQPTFILNYIIYSAA